MSQPLNIRKAVLVSESGVEIIEVGLIDAMEERGYEFVGPNLSTVVRDELKRAPVFKGLAGPFWDASALRYETPRVNEMLSI